MKLEVALYYFRINNITPKESSLFLRVFTDIKILYLS